MTALLPLVIGLVALLYASVGHAGATGYIAVMTLLGLAPQVIRPTALLLNVIVATIATVQFFRAGHFRSGLFWPLAVASVPCAAIGGAIDLPTGAFEALVGVVLLLSAIQIVRAALHRQEAGVEEASATAEGPRPLTAMLLAALGGAIGLLSGLTGVGGGVFLTPALLALRAAPVKQIAAITAPFILLNSLAGLAGGLFAGRPLPPISLPVIAAAALGGAIGSQLGAFRLPVRTLRFLMAAVLAFASVKLLGII
ncbi:MAG: sulfite exporter TauE/SafE family protein [Planctomycetia bacterium]|nr:sulfite exporter TauE/SafE family protein [Planctomycetia bacterium]